MLEKTLNILKIIKYNYQPNTNNSHLLNHVPKHHTSLNYLWEWQLHLGHPDLKSVKKFFQISNLRFPDCKLM